MASAPRRPPRLPVTLVVLVTKKVVPVPRSLGALLFFVQAARQTAARVTATIRNIDTVLSFASVPLRYRVHQERECFLEPGRAHRAALEMSEPHHDEVVRGDDQRGLPTGARHVVRLLGNRKRPG